MTVMTIRASAWTLCRPCGRIPFAFSPRPGGWRNTPACAGIQVADIQGALSEVPSPGCILRRTHAAGRGSPCFPPFSFFHPGYPCPPFVKPPLAPANIWVLRGSCRTKSFRPAGDDELQSVARLDRVDGHPVGAGPWRRYPAKLRTRASPVNAAGNAAGRCCSSITPDGSGVHANVETRDRVCRGRDGFRHSGYS